MLKNGGKTAKEPYLHTIEISNRLWGRAFKASLADIRALICG